MSNAPVCEIQPIINTQQPSPVTLPAIPLATDLPSALAAINAMAMWIRHAQQRLPPPPPDVQGRGGISGIKTKPSTPVQGRWTKVSQQTKVVRVTNPNDPTQFVDVQQIVALTMTDTHTGEKWIWTR